MDDSTANVAEDANKKSDDGAEEVDSNSTTDAEMTPTKKAARTFSQLESESAAAPVRNILNEERQSLEKVPFNSLDSQKGFSKVS